MLGLWRILFLTGLVLGVLVVGLIVWCLIRYRRRPNGQAAPFSENVRLELFYTVLPLAIVAVLFGLAVGVQRTVNRLSASPDLRIEVTGFQWGWQFRYLTQGFTIIGTSNQPPTLVLPVGSTVRLILISPDVIHSFFVPNFLEKRDVIPGITNQIDVTTTHTGHYSGFCAEFCGLDHSRMTFSVDIVPPQQFQMFAMQQQQQQQTGGSVPPGDQGGGDIGSQASPAAPASGPRGVAVG